MFLMMAEVLRLAQVARAVPDSWLWGVLGYHQSHVEWVGCSLHDMIQPSFSFLVGVALPYSIASRLAKGGTFGRMFAHAVWRAFVLAAMGIFLRSMWSPITNFTFEDTLTQIGLGYPLLFLLGFKSEKWQWSALGVILFGYWLAWAVYPVQGAGFLAHWAKNANAGHAFDVWFLNLFPRTEPFVANGGGYLTLSFIPTLGTMILGLIAGQWLRASAPLIPMKRLLVAGAALTAAGLAIHFAGVCPIVKKIWTPSWTLFSGGLCYFFLAGFSWVIDVKGYRTWARWLVVVGMNSIAAYLIAHLFEGFIESSLKIHLGTKWIGAFGKAYEPFVMGCAVLLGYWLILWWMDKRKVYLRV
jgi:predicted acyltransferase